jgi:hypothetical protein
MEQLTDAMRKQGPASEDALRSLADAAWVTLPDDYVAFMRHSNGGEGPVGHSYLEVWPVEEVVRRNSEYGVVEFLPEVMLFGSSLGGVGYGFANQEKNVAVVEVPFDSMDPQSVIRRGSSFTEFLAFLAGRWLD